MFPTNLQQNMSVVSQHACLERLFQILAWVYRGITLQLALNGGGAFRYLGEGSARHDKVN